MAQVVYRGNLSAKVFPFVSEYFGATVIIPGPDQNFQRQLVSAEDMDKDRGIPQMYYCHNVMPSAEGFQSIGYTEIIRDFKSGFIEALTLRDTSGNEVFFAHTADGSNYIIPFGGGGWTKINTIPNTVGVKVTTATINGQTYIYFAKVGCFVYDLASLGLVEVTLDGLEKTAVLGITASAGYMVAWTDTATAWSSTVEHSIPTDPIDFVPSLATGAGGGGVEAAKGKIVRCVPHYLGFIVYTTDNAIAAVYSGNSRFPFNFREIVNSGGLTDDSAVAADSGSGNHYAYTSSGLQLVSISQTQTVFPEITDFITGKYFEDFDETTLKFIRQKLTSQMKKAINVISDRYLVISYGITSLTHAIVYDSIQKRFGKLKQDHVSCFEWKPVGVNVEVPRQSIGFLKADGSISTVDFSYGSDVSSGVMLLGKYQLSRTRMITLQEVEIENIRDAAKFKLYNLVSINGKSLEPAVEGVMSGDFDAANKYNFHQTGVNHTLVAKGTFYASSIVLRFNIHGRR